MPERIRVAFIGATGHFSLKPAFATEPDLELAACASDGYGGIHPAAEKEGLPGYGDFRKMLEEIKPDAVSLGCWYAHNGEFAIECLRRGIHVITEKPALNSMEELDEAGKICSENPGLLFLTEFTSRSRECFRAARKAVLSGLIGAPVLVQSQKSYRFGASRPDFYRFRKHYSGTLMWVASHALDWVTWITGLSYLSFYGFGGNLSKPEYGEMEDNVSVISRMENGVSAVITADFLRPSKAPTHGDDRCRVAGSKGIVEVMNEKCSVVTETSGPMEFDSGGENKPAALMLAETLRGRGDGSYSTRETLRVAGYLLAAREAVDTGREISVPGKGQPR